MNEDARTERNRAMLQQCHPSLRSTLARLIAELQADGFRPRIQCAWRSQDDELEAYRTGHSSVRWGFHNALSAGGQPDALAADILDDDRPLQPSHEYLLALVRRARAHGLTTGITWNLPSNVRAALELAIATGAEWTGPLGFDPTHVETTGVTVAEAQAGQRPVVTTMTA